ncbi:class I SAM-dependent methyltransferase [Cetobacterium ceti]
MKELLFIKEFIKHFKETGAILPSSRFLARKMIDEITFDKKNVIVELGPGTGVFTKEILKRKGKTDILIVIELNELFFNNLKKELPSDDKNIILINGSASNLSDILNKLKIKKVDYIISGLPFLNFETNERKIIFDEIKKVLNGKFILFQYTKKVKKEIEKYFIIEETKKVPFNIPPANVFVCE